MDYEKMHALMEASREMPAGQRDPQLKESPKPDSSRIGKSLDSLAKEGIAT